MTLPLIQSESVSESVTTASATSSGVVMRPCGLRASVTSTIRCASGIRRIAGVSVTPARIGRLEDHGRPIAVGEPANLCLVDPTGRWTVDPAQSASRSRNTPFAGHELPSQVVATFLRGRATVLDGRPA